MNLRNLFQDTWTTGLLIFSILAFKRGNKTIETNEPSTEEKQVKIK